jgi:hypothetical protein
MDLFLDQDATTAIIEPKPIPPSTALLVKLLFCDCANSYDEIIHKNKVKKAIV